MKSVEEIRAVYEDCKRKPCFIPDKCYFGFGLCAECNVEEVLRWVLGEEVPDDTVGSAYTDDNEPK